ncbi:MAG: asparagine synthase [Calditrichaeota bacterium]|nr:MAG: asparagine synthase [Calditrichota bacterium]MBL1205353.1 asparagine synthase [Calditrichota bacterium]NOG45182.1 asparagine synthase [Calditrichota bacterium]
MKIELKNNKGFDWFHSENLHAKGYAFVGNELIINDAWVSYFEDTESSEDFHRKVCECNGFFAIVLKLEKETLVAVDHIRSFPLFYSPELNVVSDMAENLVSNFKEYQINKSASREFFSTGYVTDKDTLINGLYQAQAGEITIINSERIQRKVYYDHIHMTEEEFSEGEYLKKLNSVFVNTFTRLQTLYADKTIVISLSGGYDSRILAFMCKIMGIKDVICFTYGAKNDDDVIKAHYIAGKLGFPIHFVNYSKGSRQLYQSQLSKDYDSYAFNYVSIPHIQDFQALNYLLEENKIPQNSVVISGHCGDFISGRHLENIITNKQNPAPEDMADEIIRLQYSIFKLTKEEKNVFKNKILSLIPKSKRIDYGTVYENWIWKERMAKFLVNSIRAYEFFDLKWHLPLWDKELAEFFLALPKKYRQNQSLYRKYIETLFPDIKINIKKVPKLYWMRDIKFKRYCLLELIRMLKLSLYFSDFTKPDRRTIHKLNLVRFIKFLEK